MGCGKHTASMHVDSITHMHKRLGVGTSNASSISVYSYIPWFIRQVSDKEAKPDLVQIMQWYRSARSFEEIAES